MSRATGETADSTTSVIPSASERGSGSILMIGVMGVLLMLSLMAICIAGYLVAVHHARNAADLAALSGAARYAAGADACRAARQNANANGARVVSCGQVGDPVDFVITVRVEVTVRTGVVGLPTSIGAVAYAGAGAQ